jgi:hypothetical protein
MTKSSLESAFEDEDFLLDPRVWVAVYNKQNDHGTMKKFYSNVITGKSTEYLDPEQFCTFTDFESQTEKCS